MNSGCDSLAGGRTTLWPFSVARWGPASGAKAMSSSVVSRIAASLRRSSALVIKFSFSIRRNRRSLMPDFPAIVFCRYSVSHFSRRCRILSPLGVSIIAIIHPRLHLHKAAVDIAAPISRMAQVQRHCSGPQPAIDQSPNGLSPVGIGWAEGFEICAP